MHRSHSSTSCRSSSLESEALLSSFQRQKNDRKRRPVRGTQSWFSLLFLAVSSLRLVRGLPTMLVDSGLAKCVNVEAPMDTVIRVIYSAPDIVTDKEHPDYSPTFLSISTNPSNRVMDTKLHESPVKSRLKPKNVVLEERSGTIEHAFELDGQVAICIRASKAGSETPMRFGLRVVKTDNDPSSLEKGSGTDLDGHLSHMELEMKRIQIGMKRILAEADFAKDRDSAFHKQTQDMHAATIFWPIVQMCVLLMTGFTQASHIVRFFQSRRII